MIDNYLLLVFAIFSTRYLWTGMSAHFSHTVSNLILEAHGGIVLPILLIVGVQFTETVHR